MSKTATAAHIWTRRAAIALTLAAVLGAVAWWAARPHPIPVVVKRVDRGTVELTVVNTRAGTVEACQRTRLSTLMGGRIDYLGVKEGERVKKGQLLMRLWNEDQKAQQKLAEAQRHTARRRVDEICTLAASARREAERQSALRAKGFISSAREDSARSEADARHASCEAARADVAQTSARIQVTQTEQGRATLYAPFDGVVAKIVGELGEYSTPSPPGVATPPAIDLIDPSCLYVKAPMDEVDAPKLKAGLPVRVSLDALPKQPLAGTLRRVAPYVQALEKQARTVDIEVDFAKPPDTPLLVGYSADVEVVLGVHSNVLRIPTAALIEGGKVLVLKAENNADSNAERGTLEERKVATGLANWEYTEILAGLAEGERIVISLEREGVKVGADATVADAPLVK